MKKSLFLAIPVFLMAHCCPFPCDKEVNTAYKAIYGMISKSYALNIKDLTEMNMLYTQQLQKEAVATQLLKEYLKRVNLEYLETKKSVFLTKKMLKLETYKGSE
jgi:hypothetical protein